MVVQINRREKKKKKQPGIKLNAENMCSAFATLIKRSFIEEENALRVTWLRFLLSPPIGLPVFLRPTVPVPALSREQAAELINISLMSLFIFS